MQKNIFGLIEDYELLANLYDRFNKYRGFCKILGVTILLLNCKENNIF